MRIILFTGKGGVGKTTIAAATAVGCSELGYNTLVISTDMAHSLGDSLDLELGEDVVEIQKNLSGQEIDVNNEIRKNWDPIYRFFREFLGHHGFDNIIADEMAIFPGMEEVFSLLELRTHFAEKRYDVIVVDCAPTGETARLLALPDMAKWYMEKVFHIERTVMKAVRPMAKRFVDMPLPSDDVFDSIEGLYKNLILMKDLLSDPKTTSIRMVFNPEKMVIKEAQRAYTYLCLFGFSVDAFIGNRLLPEEIESPFHRKWKDLQSAYMKEAIASFQPVPVYKACLKEQEVFGIQLLSEMAKEIYDGKDPSRIFFKEKPMEIVRKEGGYELQLKLPYATKENLDVWVRGDELTVTYKNYKRNILLPKSLASLDLKEAKFKGANLILQFRRS
jgi:arsenite-transporting ATPase